MKIMVIYRTDDENSRAVEEFLHDYKSRTSQDLTVIDPDSREGSDLCRIYDVVEYPSILVVTDDGELRQAWRGVPLPLIGEVSYYAQ